MKAKEKWAKECFVKILEEIVSKHHAMPNKEYIAFLLDNNSWGLRIWIDGFEKALEIAQEYTCGCVRSFDDIGEDEVK